MEKAKEVTISLELLNEVVGYLGTQPYQQVAQIINKLVAAAQGALSEGNPESSNSPGDS